MSVKLYDMAAHTLTRSVSPFLTATGVSVETFLPCLRAWRILLK